MTGKNIDHKDMHIPDDFGGGDAPQVENDSVFTGDTTQKGDEDIIASAAIALENENIPAEAALVIAGLLTGYTMEEACKGANITSPEFMVMVMSNPILLQKFRESIRVAGISAFWTLINITGRIAGMNSVAEGDKLAIKVATSVATMAVPELLGRAARNKSDQRALGVLEQTDLDTNNLRNDNRGGDDKTIIPETHNEQQAEEIAKTMPGIDFIAGNINVTGGGQG